MPNRSYSHALHMGNIMSKVSFSTSYVTSELTDIESLSVNMMSLLPIRLSWKEGKNFCLNAIQTTILFCCSIKFAFMPLQQNFDLVIRLVNNMCNVSDTYYNVINECNKCSKNTNCSFTRKGDVGVNRVSIQYIHQAACFSA